MLWKKEKSFAQSRIRGGFFKIFNTMARSFLHFKGSFIRRSNWGLYRIQALISAISIFWQWI
ncbi:hypothetical protein OIU76_023207 [Salix suchowensis]|nr:hypothetical protein OIU76_023207 [Salix suchowensis]